MTAVNLAATIEAYNQGDQPVPLEASPLFVGLTQKDSPSLNLAPATVRQQVPFPVGMATAAVVMVRATGTTDLTAQVSTAGGSTVLSVPAGAPLFLYGVTALYLSSVLGGLVDVVVAG